MNEKPPTDDAAADGPTPRPDAARPEPAAAAVLPGPSANALDDDNPEWTADDFAQARPAAEALPPEVFAALVAAGKAREPVPEPPQQSPAAQPADTPASGALPPPASGSGWIDPDDAPPLTDEDFERGVWTHGDRIITREEGEAAFRAIAAVANARRRAGYPPGSDDK